MSGPASAAARYIGVWRATTIGVGAIVGGGILVLAGAALAATGPGAIIAFALNAALAVITALSFAEMATAIPRSGGAYTFAKHVLNVRAAFVVGWVMWFAYIVAAVLYALGFASYALAGISDVLEGFGAGRVNLSTRGWTVAVAAAASGAYTLSLIRKAAGGGAWETWGKVVLFAVLIVVGLAMLLLGDEQGLVARSYTPLLPEGVGGLVEAMGFTFIALQGFDLISAVGGEVRDPRNTIPRSMLTSLAIAVVIYLPLLFVVTTVGAPGDADIRELSVRHGDTVVAVAVRNYLGPVGYWIVVAAAILSTLSALQANLMAASRVALSMAADRTLPSVLGRIHKQRRTPIMAIYATELAVVAILFMVPSVASAGAAASLIFLVSFALVHWMTLLARRRAAGHIESFQTPWFPFLPAFGGVACLALAVFQGVVVPSAGGITVIWLGLGVILYFGLFANRAQAMDASLEALDPHLLRLRGRSPLVLVPVANPSSAVAMIEVGHSLAPQNVGKVLLLNVVGPREDAGSWPQLERSQEVLRLAIESAANRGRLPEALVTVAPHPWPEIARVVQEHRCESLVLGLGLQGEIAGGHLEDLLNRVDCDVAFLRVPKGFDMNRARRILVPVGGRGGQHELRSRLLGSLRRDVHRSVTFLGVLRPTDSERAFRATRAALEQLAEDEYGEATVVVVRSEEVPAAVAAASRDTDLMILGLHAVGSGRKVFGDATLSILAATQCPAILISKGA